MNHNDLTPKQAQVLAFIRGQIQFHNRPPTIREIADEHGIASTNGVRAHLAAMVRKGWITIIPRVSRGIQLMHPTPPTQDYQI